MWNNEEAKIKKERHLMRFRLTYGNSAFTKRMYVYYRINYVALRKRQKDENEKNNSNSANIDRNVLFDLLFISIIFFLQNATYRVI